MTPPHTIPRSTVVAALDSLGIKDRPFARVIAVTLDSATVSIDTSNGERTIWRIVDECASCHTPNDRPHTEYCQRACSYPLPPDGRPCPEQHGHTTHGPRLVCRRCNGYGLIEGHGVASPTPCPDCSL